MSDFDTKDPENLKMRFDNPCFTAEDVVNKFHAILSDESYKLAVNKLKVAARAAGGREKSV